MTIDPVNRANQISKTNQANSTQKNESPETKDSLNISKNAKKLAEIKGYIKIVEETPDIRLDKVEKAKKNLQSNMAEDKVIDKVAERILNIIS